MYLLKDQQIDFILDDIRRNGVELEDLQYNLLDHVCCIIERELEENGDFEQFYHTVIRRFYKERLMELEEETQTLLTFKHYYTMKKLMIASGILSVAVLGLGICFKYLYFPGAAFLITGGILLLSFLFFPLYFTLKVREEKQARDKVLVALTSLVCICVSLSVLFKVMHWPGANTLGLLSLGILLLVFLPVYFITGIRNPENKLNTVLSSVLILAGCGLFLTLTRSPRGTAIQKQQITNQLVRSEMILQGESSLLRRSKPADTGSVAFQLTRSCEQLKSSIVYRETGCSSLLADNGCKAELITDGSLDFSGNEALSSKLDVLRRQVQHYNESVDTTPQKKIPVESILGSTQQESISGAIQYLIQVEMIVLQNERELLADK